MVKLSGWRDILNDRPMPDRHRENSPAPPITVDKELSGAVHRTATADLAGWFVPQTNHKRPAQTAQGLHPGYCKSLRPEP
ncbi:hypothetical protein ALFP_0973 [Alcaligenes faecalis]|nr:hypothetical protein ALFP_0973 [Alcaligenes faecalis]